MNTRSRGVLVLAWMFALTACGSGAVVVPPTLPTTTSPPTTPSTTTPATAPGDSSPTQEIRNIWDQPPFGPLETGTYFIDPDLDPSTPLRVVYEVPMEGWSMWVGAVKSGDEGHVAVSITTVTNLVRHGCSAHSHADPCL